MLSIQQAFPGDDIIETGAGGRKSPKAYVLPDEAREKALETIREIEKKGSGWGNVKFIDGPAYARCISPPKSKAERMAKDLACVGPLRGGPLILLPKEAMGANFGKPHSGKESLPKRTGVWSSGLNPTSIPMKDRLMISFFPEGTDAWTSGSTLKGEAAPTLAHKKIYDEMEVLREASGADDSLSEEVSKKLAEVESSVEERVAGLAKSGTSVVTDDARTKKLHDDMESLPFRFDVVKRKLEEVSFTDGTTIRVNLDGDIFPGQIVGTLASGVGAPHE